ncbi:MAG: GNAT family N-acetyltransferase [Conexivisphaera sp.]
MEGGPLAEYVVKGTRYRFRLADRGDSARIVKFYESMDPETIFMRFLSAYRNFEGHVRGIFPPENPMGFVLLGEMEDVLVAEGESFMDGRRCAELAPVVHPSHRSRGLGSVTMALMVVEAARRGAICIEVYYHLENTPMARIARSLGMRLSVVEDVMHGVVGAEDGVARALDVLRRRGVALAEVTGTASSGP